MRPLHRSFLWRQLWVLPIRLANLRPDGLTNGRLSPSLPLNIFASLGKPPAGLAKPDKLVRRKDLPYCDLLSVTDAGQFGLGFLIGLKALGDKHIVHNIGIDGEIEVAVRFTETPLGLHPNRPPFGIDRPELPDLFIAQPELAKYHGTLPIGIIRRDGLRRVSLCKC